MSERRRVSWRDRYSEEATCVRCLEVHPTDDLDRLLWCPACRRRAARRATRWGWLGGIVLATLLSGWILLYIRPSRDLVFGGWIATVVAALWIGSKVVREMAYGVERYRNRRAVDATPPVVDEPGADEPPPPA